MGSKQLSVADTFRSSSYTGFKSSKPVELYRVQSVPYTGGRMSSYWTTVKPTGPIQATVDAALHPSFNNKATHWIEIEVPAGTVYYGGIAAEQRGLVGGGIQVFTEDVLPQWIKTQGSF